MKRVLFAVLAFGCGPNNDVVAIEGGIQPANIELAVPTFVTVVAGEGATIDVDVTAVAVPAPSLTISTSPLPDGVTCAPIVVSVTTSIHAKLICLASTSAAISELPIDIRASFDGKIAGSASTSLAVSSVVGSLDPTFGAGGVLPLPTNADNPTAIGVAKDGTIVVAGLGANRIFVERFAPSAEPPVPWQFGGNIASARGSTIASDGRVAIHAQDVSNNDSITEVDATNTVIVTKYFPPTTALAWDGDDLFVATTQDLRRFGPSGDALLASGMTVASLETLAHGTVLAVGVEGSSTAVLDTFTVSGGTFDPSPPIEISAGNMHATNTVTTLEGTLVGLAGPDAASVVRLDSTGTVVATYPLDARWARASEVVALPSGEPLVLGTTQLQMGSNKNINALTGYIVGFDATFGVQGHTYILGASTVAAGAIDPSGQFLYVTGTTPLVHGWVARIRLTSN